MGGRNSRNKQAGSRPITIAIFGIDNAGKTTTAKVLERTSVENIAPTVGFGGECSFREAWRHYYDDPYGFIYVIDCSNPARFDESRQELEQLLQIEQVQNKPMLILANKQDKIGAFDKNTILQKLEIEPLLTTNRNLYRVELCTAKLPTANGKSPPIDLAIQNGFDWLVKTIYENYSTLHKRVQQDVQQRDEKVKLERQEMLARIREKRATQEDKRNDDDHDHSITNGFVPIGEAVKNAEKNSASHTTGF